MVVRSLMSRLVAPARVEFVSQGIPNERIFFADCERQLWGHYRILARRSGRSALCHLATCSAAS
jgi:hypothetical protein